jgi:hypothetical protein
MKTQTFHSFESRVQCVCVNPADILCPSIKSKPIRENANVVAYMTVPNGNSSEPPLSASVATALERGSDTDRRRPTQCCANPCIAIISASLYTHFRDTPLSDLCCLFHTMLASGVSPFICYCVIGLLPAVVPLRVSSDVQTTRSRTRAPHSVQFQRPQCGTRSW